MRVFLCLVAAVSLTVLGSGKIHSQSDQAESRPHRSAGYDGGPSPCAVAYGASASPGTALTTFEDETVKRLLNCLSTPDPLAAHHLARRACAGNPLAQGLLAKSLFEGRLHAPHRRAALGFAHAVIHSQACGDRLRAELRGLVYYASAHFKLPADSDLRGTPCPGHPIADETARAWCVQRFGCPAGGQDAATRAWLNIDIDAPIQVQVDARGARPSACRGIAGVVRVLLGLGGCGDPERPSGPVGGPTQLGLVNTITQIRTAAAAGAARTAPEKVQQIRIEAPADQQPPAVAIVPDDPVLERGQDRIQLEVRASKRIAAIECRGSSAGPACPTTPNATDWTPLAPCSGDSGQSFDVCLDSPQKILLSGLGAADWRTDDRLALDFRVRLDGAHPPVERTVVLQRLPCPKVTRLQPRTLERDTTVLETLAGTSIPEHYSLEVDRDAAVVVEKDGPLQYRLRAGKGAIGNGSFTVYGYYAGCRLFEQQVRVVAKSPAPRAP